MNNQQRESLYLIFNKFNAILRSNEITDARKFKLYVMYVTYIILTLLALHWVIVKDIWEIDLLLLFFEDTKRRKCCK